MRQLCNASEEAAYYGKDHVDILQLGGGDAEQGEKQTEATHYDHDVGRMDHVVGVQKATGLVRLWVRNEPYADAQYGAAEHLTAEV